MKCMIKRGNAYLDKHLFDNQNHWVYKDSAKIFESVAEARAYIKIYKIKNVEIEKIAK